MLPLNEIICGDSAEVLKTFPDQSIDAILTSPPYDNLRAYNGYTFDFEAIAKEMVRVLKPGGIIVWIVQDGTINGEKTGTSFQQAIYFKIIGLKLHDTLIYSRQGVPGEYKGRFRTDHEYMFVLKKLGAHTCNKNLIKIPAKHPNKIYIGTKQRERDGTTRKLAREREGVEIGETKNRGTVWEYGIANAEKGMSRAQRTMKSKHPATFPDQLAKDLITCWSNPGDIILDPMMGSGTTALAAKRLGRNFIGIDISQEYCNMARERIDADGSPPPSE